MTGDGLGHGVGVGHGGAGLGLKSPCPSEDDGHRGHVHDDSDNIDVESDEEELDLLSSDSCLSPADARPAVGRGVAAPTTNVAAPAATPTAAAAAAAAKPKIWSLADMAGVNRSSSNNNNNNNNSGGGVAGAAEVHASPPTPHLTGAAFPSPFGVHLSQALTLRGSPFLSTGVPPGQFIHSTRTARKKNKTNKKMATISTNENVDTNVDALITRL